MVDVIRRLHSWVRRSRLLSGSGLYQRAVSSLLYWRASVVVVTIPGSGTNWLEALLGKVLSERANRPFGMSFWSYADNNTPLFYSIHDGFKNLRDSPEAIVRHYRNKAVVLLVRDPRDALVSYYYYRSRRRQLWSGDISSFVKAPGHRVERMVALMNAWLKHPNLYFARYEDLHQDTKGTLRGILDFMGISGVSDDMLTSAVTFATFENQRERERGGAFVHAGTLNLDDPNSHKFRSGRVGAYPEHLGPEDVEHMTKVIREELDPRYGYTLG